MIVKWEMSIGFPGAKQTGEVEILPEDLEGMTPEQKREVIDRIIWEDAMQYVDVYPANKEEMNADIEKLAEEGGRSGSEGNQN